MALKKSQEVILAELTESFENINKSFGNDGDFSLLNVVNLNGDITSEQRDALLGILHLIDGLQDYAVDELDIPEMHVFDFQEEEREGNTTVNIKTPNEKLFVMCANCKSDNVELKHWVNANTNKIGDCTDDDEDSWCNDCETHSGVYAAKLKPESKVIGFQVVGEEGTSVEGDIHPDMDASFCIYSLSQAREMLKNNDIIWRLLSVWENDIEEPTYMFVGDPRD